MSGNLCRCGAYNGIVARSRDLPKSDGRVARAEEAA